MIDNTYLDENDKIVKLVDLSTFKDQDGYIFEYDFPYKDATRNIFNLKIYPDDIKPLVREELVNPLLEAAKELKSQGYKIKIWDAFRPQECQIKLWNYSLANGFSHIVANPEGYGVCNPTTIGSSHTKGIALDLTLIDINTKEEIDMGSPYDCIDERANYDAKNISEDARKNRKILNDALSLNFLVLPNEWWHYIYKEDYPLIINKI